MRYACQRWSRERLTAALRALWDAAARRRSAVDTAASFAATRLASLVWDGWTAWAGWEARRCEAAAERIELNGLWRLLERALSEWRGEVAGALRLADSLVLAAAVATERRRQAVMLGEWAMFAQATSQRRTTTVLAAAPIAAR